MIGFLSYFLLKRYLYSLLIRVRSTVDLLEKLSEKHEHGGGVCTLSRESQADT